MGRSAPVALLLALYTQTPRWETQGLGGGRGALVPGGKQGVGGQNPVGGWVPGLLGGLPSPMTLRHIWSVALGAAAGSGPQAGSAPGVSGSACAQQLGAPGHPRTAGSSGAQEGAQRKGGGGVRGSEREDPRDPSLTASRG